MAEAGHDHVYLALRLRTAPATRSRSSSLDASAWMAWAPMSCTASSSASGPPMSVEVIRARFDLSRVRPTDVHVQFNPSHVLKCRSPLQEGDHRTPHVIATTRWPARQDDLG